MALVEEEGEVEKKGQPEHAKKPPAEIVVHSGDLESWFDAVIGKAHASLKGQVDGSATTIIKRVEKPSALNVTLVSSEEAMRLAAEAASGGSSTNDANQGKQDAVVESSSIKLHTVTYASHGGRDDRFCRAVESSIRHGFDLVILGWGVAWRGLSQKLEAAHAYAAALPESHAILFTDAFDVLFCDTPDNILAQYLLQDAPLLFSAECGCWPHVMEDQKACFDGPVGKSYPKSPTPYRYLNSGTWIGMAKPATDMLKAVMVEAGNQFGNANDQKLVADMYMAGRFGIKLDFYNKLFQSMHMTLDPPLPRCNPVSDVELAETNHKWRNKLTNSEPAVLHFNGGGKAHHLSMEGRMWYKAPQHNTPEKRQELASHLVSVPDSAAAPTGKMRFDELCGSYLNQYK